MTVNSSSQEEKRFLEQIERVLTTKQISRQEYFQLVTLFLSDFAVNERDRQSINQIFDELQIGKMRFI